VSVRNGGTAAVGAVAREDPRAGILFFEGGGAGGAVHHTGDDLGRAGRGADQVEHLAAGGRDGQVADHQRAGALMAERGPARGARHVDHAVGHVAGAAVDDAARGAAAAQPDRAVGRVHGLAQRGGLAHIAEAVHVEPAADDAGRAAVGVVGAGDEEVEVIGLEQRAAAGDLSRKTAAERAVAGEGERPVQRDRSAPAVVAVRSAVVDMVARVVLADQAPGGLIDQIVEFDGRAAAQAYGVGRAAARLGGLLQAERAFLDINRRGVAAGHDNGRAAHGDGRRAGFGDRVAVHGERAVADVPAPGAAESRVGVQCDRAERVDLPVGGAVDDRARTARAGPGDRDGLLLQVQRVRRRRAAEVQRRAVRDHGAAVGRAQRAALGDAREALLEQRLPRETAVGCGQIEEVGAGLDQRAAAADRARQPLCRVVAREGQRARVDHRRAGVQGRPRDDRVACAVFDDRRGRSVVRQRGVDGQRAAGIVIEFKLAAGGERRERTVADGQSELQRGLAVGDSDAVGE